MYICYSLYLILQVFYDYFFQLLRLILTILSKKYKMNKKIIILVLFISAWIPSYLVGYTIGNRDLNKIPCDFGKQVSIKINNKDLTGAISLYYLYQNEIVMISNDSISWELLRKSINNLSNDSIEKSKFFIKLKNYEKQIEYIKMLDNNSIMKLLQDEKTDWATNLLLYAINDRDADLFFVFRVKTRLVWIEYLKEEDLKYWSKLYS